MMLYNQRALPVGAQWAFGNNLRFLKPRIQSGSWFNTRVGRFIVIELLLRSDRSG